MVNTILLSHIECLPYSGSHGVLMKQFLNGLQNKTERNERKRKYSLLFKSIKLSHGLDLCVAIFHLIFNYYLTFRH